MNQSFFPAILGRIFSPAFLAVVFCLSSNATAQLPVTKTQQQSAEQQESEASAAELLGAGSRDLMPAVELGNSTATESERTYIIYYANETDPTSVDRLADWLAASSEPGHPDSAKQLRGDAEKFPRVVNDEISKLVAGVANDPLLGLIVFTNSMARRGEFQFMDCETQQPILAKWPVYKSKLKVFVTHPLAHPNNLGLALKAAAERVGKAKLAGSDFVLITKSHGTAGLAIAQGYAPLHQANSQPKLLAIISELKDAAEKSKTADKIVKSEHQIRFDRDFDSEAKFSYMGDDTLGAGGDVAISTLGVGAGDDDPKLGIAKQNNPNGLTIADLGSTLGDSGSVDDPKLGIAKQNNPNGLTIADLGSTLGDSGSVDDPKLGTAKQNNPNGLTIADMGSTLGDSGSVDDPKLGMFNQNNRDGLSIADTASTLSAGAGVSDNTLGISNGQAAKFLCSGTTKQQLIQAVVHSGKLGMQFNTVFLEACQSELSQQSLEQFRQQPNINIGRLYVSNATGLRYRTIDYSQLFALHNENRAGQRFTKLLTEQLNEVARIHAREGLPREPGKAELTYIAHRGASGYLPEHTLEAYALAYGMGADFIEQDVVLTKDDQAIVLHDIYLDTVTNVAQIFPERKREDGRYYAIDFTLAEIKSLSVHERVDLETGEPVFGNRFPESKLTFQIPTLVEAITLIQGLNRATGRNVGIYPEIKKPKWHRDQNKDISQIVLKLLKDRGYGGDTDAVYLQCFDPVELRRIREDLKCELKLVQLIGSNDWNEASVDYNDLVTAEGLEKIAQYADGIGPWMPYIIKGRTEQGTLDRTDLVAMAHGHDLVVHPFTFRADSLPDYTKDYSELVRIFANAGVDGIFTDQVDQARQAFSPSKQVPNALLHTSSKGRQNGDSKKEEYEPPSASSSKFEEPFSENVANAWQDSGAELGWIDPTQLDWIDVVKFYSNEQVEKAGLVKPGLLPTIRFKEIDWDVLGELPAPESEFVIILDGVDLEGLKFENLTRFTSLVGLDINRAEPTGEQVLQIANLKRLRLLSLNFGFTLIPEEILAKLVDLEGLQFLDIAGVLPSKRITTLLPKFSKLKVLRLDLGTYTKSELKPLSGLRDLRALCLGGIDLDETWLSGLENCPKLEYLDLSATKTGRHSLNGFEKLKTLKTLNLMTTKTSDDSVDVLKSLTSLRELKLSNCIMSDESKKVLKSALRHCKIEF